MDLSFVVIRLNCRMVENGCLSWTTLDTSGTYFHLRLAANTLLTSTSFSQEEELEDAIEKLCWTSQQP